MKQGFTLFVAAIVVVLSTLRSANAGPLEDCFGPTNELGANKVYICSNGNYAKSLIAAKALYLHLNSLTRAKSANMAELKDGEYHKMRPYGGYDVVSVAVPEGRLDCYKLRETWNPKTKAEIKNGFSCLLYTGGAGSGGDNEEPPLPAYELPPRRP
jgi:hypothetical protein